MFEPGQFVKLRYMDDEELNGRFGTIRGTLNGQWLVSLYKQPYKFITCKSENMWIHLYRGESGLVEIEPGKQEWIVGEK